MDDFDSLDTPGGPVGVRIVEWNQNQLILSVWPGLLVIQIQIQTVWLVSHKNISFDVRSGVVIAVIWLFTVVLETQPEIGFGQKRVNMIV